MSTSDDVTRALSRAGKPNKTVRSVPTAAADSGAACIPWLISTRTSRLMKRPLPHIQRAGSRARVYELDHEPLELAEARQALLITMFHH